MRRLAAVTAFPVLLLAAGPAVAPADAAERLVIKGAGFGHGVGMSQYGAYGYAQHGVDYRTILKHYFTGTEITRDASSHEVTVLLAGGKRRLRITGATAAGPKKLNPASTYVASLGGKGVQLKRGAKRVFSSAGPFRVSNGDGSEPFTLVGKGTYRGSLELRPSFGGVTAINALGIETYVRGVVAGESPPSWPADALRAQAVAARTYALTSDAGTASDGFTQYDDTRSQVYAGVRNETPATDRAVADTSGELVTYNGIPVTTYFFSTSGGQTENIENSFIGATPQPWLRSVEDPYDDASPKHRWEVGLTVSQAQRKLHGLVKGKLRRIDVTQRGVSPRVVRATIVGSRGTTDVDGPLLRRRFGLNDTWADFILLGAKPDSEVDSDGTGGLAAQVRRSVVRGAVRPARRGATIRVQRRAQDGAWREVTRAPLRRGGRYRAVVPGPGIYRIAYGRTAGPTVRVSP
jgi:stage II sporulation protein D